MLFKFSPANFCEFRRKTEIPNFPGEEIFAWPGRLSNSEMIARHGFGFRENPVGIGRNVSQPPSWSEERDSKGRKEPWEK